MIPAYNCAGTILATLESIAAQTVSDFEVIIVNDGSKDATADVLQVRKHGQPLSFITIPNNGPGNARNQGIARAQGRYLFLMDADDEIEQHTLERYQTILTGEAPDLIVASYNLRVLDNQEIVSEKQVIAEDRTYAEHGVPGESVSFDEQATDVCHLEQDLPSGHHPRAPDCFSELQQL